MAAGGWTPWVKSWADWAPCRAAWNLPGGPVGPPSIEVGCHVKC